MMGVSHGEFWIMDTLKELVARVDRVQEYIGSESELESESLKEEMYWVQERAGMTRLVDSSLLLR